MGKLLLYKAGKACLSYACAPNIPSGYTSAQVHTFQCTDGTEGDRLSCSSSNGTYILTNAQFYKECTAYASADTEEDFSLDHYTTRAIADLTIVKDETAQRGGRIITVAVTNNGASAVDVGSLKFTKVLRKDNNNNYPEALIFGYFLDTPVTIGVGETKTFALNFDT